MSNFDDLSGIWDIVKAHFLTSMTEDAVNLWFGDLKLTGLDGDTLTMSTPSELKFSIINKKYIDTLSDQFSKNLGFDVTVKLELEDKAAKAMAEEKKDPENPSTMPTYNFEYTFDNFIVGASNKFAHAACTAVAEHPATSYNPLFIYGPSGIGKTHLLYAITNKVKHDKPDVKIIYVKGEDFTNQFIEALSQGKNVEFRSKYRSCDMLLIDDIQFIAGKVSMQEEFFNTFNTLYEEHKQIILTSDRPPREMKTLEDRLKTRFEWGLLADVQPPDLELRIAIIKKKAEQVGIQLSDDVLSFLAENLRSNIRQIEGAIKKLGAVYYLEGKQITIDNAKECIADLLDGQIPIESLINRTFSAIYNKYGITKDELIGLKRTKEIANARHVCIYLIRNIVEISLPSIGKIFNRDHSTVMSSIENVEKRLKSEAGLRRDLEELQKEIQN